MTPVAPPDWLLATMGHYRAVTPPTSEKSRTEAVIYPILVAAAQSVPGSVCVFSGQRLEVHVVRGLHGVCDFLFARTAPLPRPTAPLLAVVEVVETMEWDVSAGLGRCIGALATADEFNRRAGAPLDHVFGCRTDGIEWQFLRLTGKAVVLDYGTFVTADLPRLLGALRLTLLVGL